MANDWESLGEKVDDRQPSGGEIRYSTEYPFQKMFMTVAGCGVIVVEELIPTMPKPFSERSVRLGAWKNEELIPKRDAAEALFKYYKDNDGREFPDEGEYDS